jgi:RNA polymerase-binding transcription factor DksA
MLNAHQIEKFRKILHQLRAGLDDRAPAVREEASHGAGGESAGGLSNAPIHLADMGSQEAEVVVSVGLAENEAFIRREIDDALTRLDEGKFGICERCRNLINRDRLAAVPYSRLCIHCAEASQQGRF